MSIKNYSVEVKLKMEFSFECEAGGWKNRVEDLIHKSLPDSYTIIDYDVMEHNPDVIEDRLKP